MRSLYEAEIPIKVYRTWFLLNSRTTISVKTPASLSESQEAGELCAQGSGGAALQLRERLLSCHPTKTTYILFGTEKYKKEVRQEFLRSPLMFGDFRMIDNRGMAGCVGATIVKRIGRIKGAMWVIPCQTKEKSIKFFWGEF